MASPQVLHHKPDLLDIEKIKTAQEFNLWKKQAVMCMKVNGLTALAKDVQCAHILLLCGPSVIKHEDQFVYGDGESKDDPDILWKKIESLCIPEKSEVMERYRLREIPYEDDMGKKSFDSFLLRVKAQADLCNYNIAERDKLIRDKIVYTVCPSWRKSIFKQSGNPTLQKVVDICRANEQAELHSSEINQTTPRSSMSDVTSNDLLASINKVYEHMQRQPAHSSNQRSRKPSFKRKPTNGSVVDCGFCGYTHIRSRKACPAAAEGATCNNCGKPGHFQAKCQSPRIRRVDDTDSDPEFESTSSNGVNNGKYPTLLTASFITNNVKVRFTLDSGAEVNTINKKFVPNKLIMPTHKKLTMWNGTKLVPMGQCLISLHNPKNGENHKVHFIVVDNSLDNLLGAETLSRLNLITVNKENFVGNVTSSDTTSKVMKLGDLGTAKLYVDPKVTPKVLPCRRIPESKHDKVCRKLQQMISHDILGHVDHPTDWVSQMCCVERADRDDIRICIDPGPLNKALKREHYRLPTLDDILPKLKNAKIFCKVDVSKAFLHVKLDYESSLLTTMNTPLGRLRWKRLAYGLKPASEIFEKGCMQHWVI